MGSFNKVQTVKIVMLIIAVLALGVLGYYSWTIIKESKNTPALVSGIGSGEKKSDSATTTNSATTATAQNTPCADSLTSTDKAQMPGWKTFTNTEYNHSFKYPDDWSIADTGVNKWTEVSVVSGEEDIAKVSNIIIVAGDKVSGFTTKGLNLESETDMQIICQTVKYSFYNQPATTDNPRNTNVIRAPFTHNGTNFLATMFFPASGSASLDSDYGELFQQLIRSLEFK